MSRWPKSLCLLAAGALLCVEASADVMIETVSADGASSRILITDTRARIETGNDGYYLLLDLDAGTILAVNEQDRIAMDMKSPIPQRSEHGDMILDLPPLNVRLTERRDGPVIAGFATIHYRVMVDDIHCYDEYLAPALLEDKAIRRFVAAMSEGSDNAPMRALIRLTDPSRTCEAADDLIDDHYPLAGVPLRTLDAKGRVVHEVRQITFDARHDPALFRLPAGYPVLSRDEVMQRMLDDEFDPEELQRRLLEIERQMQQAGPDA